MKKFLFVIGLVGALQAFSATVKPYAEALNEAKNKKNDIIVLCIGSGWIKESTRMLIDFKQAASRYVSNDLIWAVYDEKKNITGEERKALGGLPLEIFGMPCWIYMDCNQRPLWHEESITLSDLQTKISRSVKILSTARKNRDEMLKKADRLQGIEKAKMIGKALDPTINLLIAHYPFVTLNKYMARYRDFVNQFKELDPEDRLGYAYKLEFFYLPIMEGTILKNCNEKNFNANYQYVDQKLALPALAPKQRQQLTIFKFTTALREGNLGKALSFLDQAISIAPKSETADECRRAKKYYTEPVKLNGLRWERYDNRPRWTEAIVDVTSVLKGTGKYSLNFKHDGGHTKFRNPVIKSGNQVLAEMKGEKRYFEFSLKSHPLSRIYLHVKLQGTGWFDGQGNIEIEKK